MYLYFIQLQNRADKTATALRLVNVFGSKNNIFNKAN